MTQPADGAPAEPIDDRHPLRVLLGGPWGAVESMAPTVLFVLAYFASGNSLAVAVGVALGVAVILAGVKIARREKPIRVLAGLLGVAVAALFAAYQDDPLGFFQIRVLANILSAVAFAGSILIRRPLMGVIIGPLMGTGMRWRQDPDLLKAYSRVTWLWAILSLVRAAIQIPLIESGQLAWLGATPFLFYGLVAITIAASWWVIRKTLPPSHPGIRHPQVPAATA
jgi:intracellular septation protein A